MALNIEILSNKEMRRTSYFIHVSWVTSGLAYRKKKNLPNDEKPQRMLPEEIHGSLAGSRKIRWQTDKMKADPLSAFSDSLPDETKGRKQAIDSVCGATLVCWL